MDLREYQKMAQSFQSALEGFCKQAGEFNEKLNEALSVNKNQEDKTHKSDSLSGASIAGDFSRRVTDEPKEGEVWVVRCDSLNRSWVGYFYDDRFCFDKSGEGSFALLCDVEPIQRLYTQSEMDEAIYLATSTADKTMRQEREERLLVQKKLDELKKSDSEWDGKGLPPAGLWVEARYPKGSVNTDWWDCKVVAYGNEIMIIHATQKMQWGARINS